MSRSKDIGTAAETAVVRYLREHGFPWADRRVTHGKNDTGDIAIGDPDIVIEVKRCKAMSLAGWLDETEKERENAGARIGLLWHWRRGKGSPGEWYVTMTGATAARLLREHCGLEEL